MNDTSHPTMANGRADVIIPVFRERGDALEATIDACLHQEYPASQILVVDDGSPIPVSIPERLRNLHTVFKTPSVEVRLLRLEENSGISAARNFAIAHSTAALVACVNCEVLPAPDWLQACSSHLSQHPRAAGCFTRIVPENPKRLLSRWRMRFQEPKYGDLPRSMFAPGHAVLFRREALDSVGGYDIRFRRVREDFDICERLKNAGWETHYITESRCISIQDDGLLMLSRKALARSDWHSPEDYSFPKVVVDQTRWLMMRLGRNLVKFRFYFWPVDLAVWAGAMAIAACAFLRPHTRTVKEGIPNLRRS